MVVHHELRTREPVTRLLGGRGETPLDRRPGHGGPDVPGTNARREAESLRASPSARHG